MWKNAIAFLGLGAPFVYAALTYFVFRYVDNKASAQAKNAISSWLNSTHIDKRQSAAVALEIFDRLYTSPLWGWRAIARSFAYTSIITIIVVWQIYPALFWLYPAVPTGMQIQWSQRIFCNYIADYAALYLIRRWLIAGSGRPLAAAFVGPILGVAVLICLYTITDVIRFSIETSSFHPIYFVQGAVSWITSFADLKPGSRFALLAPALVVHLWLPLFAIGVLLTQSLNYFLKASVWMQWFIKRGKSHPFEAIGYVAAVVSFAIAGILQWF